MRDHGLEYLLATTVLRGMQQIAAGGPAAGSADALHLALGFAAVADADRLRNRLRG